MIGFKLDQMKSMFFFDKEGKANPLLKSLDKAARDILSRFGAFVRRTAKSSIRKRKRISAPGKPPSSHTGLLKNFIFFGYDATKQSVVVGPIRLNTRVNAPEVLEYGGTVSFGAAKKIFRKVGGAGEIRIGGRVSATTKKNRFGAMVTYGKLRTQAQADRANELQTLLYGGITATIAARPYMHPALTKELPKLPAMWRDSVKP